MHLQEWSRREREKARVCIAMSGEVSQRWVRAYDMFVNSDKSLVSDLSKVRGKPIDGDLDVDE
jgi:ABC-type xylose transport system substrate-binding protein